MFDLCFTFLFYRTTISFVKFQKNAFLNPFVDNLTGTVSVSYLHFLIIIVYFYQYSIGEYMMKTLAIIAEYNPFHNGHFYQLHKAKEITGANRAIAVMSGNFLQRGIPAMWDKYLRANMAVLAGIDMVLELPFVYATGSAYDFAMGAIHMLNKLESIDYLCFGAETDDLAGMLSVARIFVEEPEEYKQALQTELANGKSYPCAREEALYSYLNSHKSNTIISDNLKDILSLPNNTLALEYLCALIRTNSKIIPVLIKREQSNYHDNALQQTYSSANAIRQKLLEGNDALLCEKQLPATSLSLINKANGVTAPIVSSHLSELLQGVRINHLRADDICDFDKDLADRFSKLPLQLSYEEVQAMLQTKNKTASRIARALIHYLLNYKQKDRIEFQNNGYIYYACLLAFNKNASSLIKQINTNGKIKIITKKADYLLHFDNELLPTATSMWEFDMKATELYNTLVYNRFKTTLPNDYQQTPIIV